MTRPSDAPDPSHSPSEDEKDIALMLQVKVGNHEAFQQLLERHQNAVIGTVTKMLGNHSESEDIAQQVFIRLWKAAPNYQVKAKFTTFLYTITRHLVFNESRRRAKHRAQSVEQQEEDNHLSLAVDPSLTPNKEALYQELKDSIEHAIESLPETQRLAVILRRYENLSYEEIASILDLSISAVKSHLFRARTNLREQLSNYLSEQ